MEQLPIDFSPRARSTDPLTSLDACRRVDGSALAAQVLTELRLGGPGTCHELAARTGLSLVTVSPRMRPLELAGRARRAGRRDGRTVWEAV